MNFKISIVIPVYNAENTIENAINSIINQTIGFNNIELILIDDKSTDNSREIIEKYSTKYNNIKSIFLTENSGSPSHPRNIGIKHVTSNYVMFLDSDDMYTLDCLNTLYTIAKKENPDVIQCIYLRKIKDSYYVYDDVFERTLKYNEVIYNTDKLKLRGTIWGNLFKTSLIQNIKFQDVLHEDALFSLECFIDANKIIKLPNFYGYIYTIDNKSITHKISPNHMIKYLKGFKLQNNLLNKKGIEKNEFFNITIPMIFYMFFKINTTKKEKLSLLMKIHDFEKELNYSISLKSKPLDILNKLVLDKKYNIALILSKIASMLYNCNIIREYFFLRDSHIKKVDENLLNEKNIIYGL